MRYRSYVSYFDLRGDIFFCEFEGEVELDEWLKRRGKFEVGGESFGVWDVGCGRGNELRVRI